jgi:hypothetical protein
MSYDDGGMENVRLLKPSSDIPCPIWSSVYIWSNQFLSVRMVPSLPMSYNIVEIQFVLLVSFQQFIFKFISVCEPLAQRWANTLT